MCRIIEHGIVKSLVKNAARLADIDITNEYFLDFKYVNVKDFKSEKGKRNNYSVLNDIKHHLF